MAIGECGLEFLGDFDKESKEFLFRKQIELAQKYKKPLIIHANKRLMKQWKILKEYENLSGVFHCYAGGNKRIKKVLELGENWYFGIDGNLTYEERFIHNVGGKYS